MRRDRVVIAVVIVTVVSAILFGVLMAYRTYKLPMHVYDIDNTILTIKGKSKEEVLYTDYKTYPVGEERIGLGQI